MAKLLANIDRTIEMPNGFKMIIKVRNSVPLVKLDATIRERMKLAMAKRYNPATKALDLTQFHLDVDLTDIYCGLARAPIFAAVAEIIIENIKELEALNLDGNKIHTLEMFRHFLNKMPSLKILYLSNNKVISETFSSVFFSFCIYQLLVLYFVCTDWAYEQFGYIKKFKYRRLSSQRKSTLYSYARPKHLHQVYFYHNFNTNAKCILLPFLSSIRLRHHPHIRF